MPRIAHYRACPLCEAICGLSFQYEGDRLVAIRGDDADPLLAKGVVQELLSPTLTGQLELMITTFQPVSRTGRGGRLRKSEEAGVLLTGTLDLHVDGKCFHLTAGDSYSLRHKGRHRFENRGKVPAVLVCVVTPPSAY